MAGDQPSGPEKPWVPPTQQWHAPAAPPPPPVPPASPPPTGQGGRNPWPFVVAALLVLLLAGVGVFVLAGGEDEASAQTVRFQQPTDPGPDPFTRRADVRGEDRVRVGSGPFGGTGSDLVCDRDMLIRSLRARPDRLREWARVLGIEPTAGAVTRYIRRLRPVTLTRDTRVTNHSFVGGRAVAFQAILQAGTAVLVDDSGKPVVRCRCGNPLLEPLPIEEAKCLACPADYRPPPPCSDYADCYRRYPHPPPVVIYAPRRRERERPPEAPPPAGELENGPASASFDPAAGTTSDTYTLYVANFRPFTRVRITLTRPDGVTETYSLRTDNSGNGTYTFPRDNNPVTGTYVARLTDGDESATATTTVSPSAGDPVGPTDDIPEETPQGEVGGGGTPPPEDAPLQCDPPRSQLEFERCREQGN